MRKLKGGIETIIALVIIVGIVLALIIATVLPITDQSQELGEAGVNKIDSLTSAIE